MTKNVFWIGVVLALLVAGPARVARAQDWYRSTHVTFTQPIDISDAIQTTPVGRDAVATVANYMELPKTASLMPGVLFVGLGFLVLGLALKLIVTRM